jgi:hypothetical protein
MVFIHITIWVFEKALLSAIACSMAWYKWKIDMRHNKHRDDDDRLATLQDYVNARPFNKQEFLVRFKKLNDAMMFEMLPRVMAHEEAGMLLHHAQWCAIFSFVAAAIVAINSICRYGFEPFLKPKTKHK